MKKIILSITSIIVGAIFAIILVLVLSDKKKEVYINSSYNDVKISFGKTKVKKVDESNLSAYGVARKYYISDTFEFYEENIKSSKYYNSNLVFEYDNNIYGYLIKDEVAFNYKISDKFIYLSTMGVRGHMDSSYNLLLCDIYNFAYTEKDINLYGKDEYKWYIQNESKNITYENIVELYKNMNQDMVKIDGDTIYLKGYDFNLKMSDDYIVKIVNEDGYAYGYAYEYPISE